MKNGFYLSTYVFIDPLSHLTRCECRHDMNISLWEKRDNRIKLVHYWELERVSGEKNHKTSFYDIEHAKKVINMLLSKYNLSINDMVEVWGTPGISTQNDCDCANDFPEFAFHSICHLFSSLLLNTDIFYNQNILALSVDAGPDTVIDPNANSKFFYTGCYSEKGNIKELLPIYSPGPLWARAANYYNMKEGSLMALACASKSELIYSPEIKFLAKTFKDIETVTNRLNDLFEFVNRLAKKDEGRAFTAFDPDFSEKDNKISMVMKEIQKLSVAAMDENIKQMLKRYGINAKDTYLGMSGGFALNCSTNSYMVNKYGFKGFIAPPCINDGGLSLGLALYKFYKNNRDKIDFTFEHPYYGDKDEDLHSILDQYKEYIESYEELEISKFADDIVKTPIVWFNGSAEVGPRALGGRSILADARTLQSKEILNKVKKRQWWRPVAPIILEEEIGNWFEQAYHSPYMLHTFVIKKDKADRVPAIVHLDNSARVQTINKKNNPLLYELLTYFNNKYGVPLLCNTSLNDRGEPIINTMGQMVNFVLRKGLKVAYVNGVRIAFKNHALYKNESPECRSGVFENYIEDSQREVLLKKLNPHDVSIEDITVYVQNPKVRSLLDITKVTDARTLHKLVKANNKTIDGENE